MAAIPKKEEKAVRKTTHKRTSSSSSSSSSVLPSLFAMIGLSLTARILFSLVLLDPIAAFVGKEPFSIATVDSSGSYWKERLFWERAAERVSSLTVGGSSSFSNALPSTGISSSISSDNNKSESGSVERIEEAFIPFYLEQIPFWPVKLFMLLEDYHAYYFKSGIIDVKANREDGGVAVTSSSSSFFVLTAKTVPSGQSGDLILTPPTAANGESSAASSPASSSSSSGEAHQTHRRRVLSVRTFFSIGGDAIAKVVLVPLKASVDPQGTTPLGKALSWILGENNNNSDDDANTNTSSSDDDVTIADVVEAVGELFTPQAFAYYADEVANAYAAFKALIFASASPSSSSSPFGIAEGFLIFIDAVLVPILLAFVSVRAEEEDGAEEEKDGAANNNNDNVVLLKPEVVPTETTRSPFLHAINPLSVFCCCTLSLRVLEHAILLCLACLLVWSENKNINKSEEKKENDKNKKNNSSLLSKIALFPLSIILTTLLVGMSPGMVVLFIPVFFHFVCNDGHTTFVRFALVSLAIFILSGYVAFKASIGLAELPTTTPPDAGHQSYLWQVLLPEIAELAQATFVIGPVVAVTIIALQLCDPVFHLRGYRLIDVDEAVSAALTQQQQQQEESNNADDDEKEGEDADAKEKKEKKSDTVVVKVPTSRVFSPVRALFVISILFSAIVRRYYSLFDTLFTVIVVPTVISPHINYAMMSSSSQGLFFIIPFLMMFVSIPLQHATYTSWVVKQMANANWLYFANLIHHGGLCLYSGQFIYSMLRPCYELDEDRDRQQQLLLKKQKKDAAAASEKGAADGDAKRRWWQKLRRR